MLVTAPSLLAGSRAAAAAARTAQVVDIGDLLVPADGDRSGTAPGGQPLPGNASFHAGTPGPRQVALLPYSSGTTGLPKGVMLTHANLTAAARQVGCGLALTPRDRVLGVAPLAHVMGFVVALCAPLAAGATVVMLPRYGLRAVLAAVRRHRVTVVLVPPQVAAALARDPAVCRYDLSGVEMVISGGAPLGGEPVIPRPDPRTGEVPVAVVVPCGTLEPSQLIAWVAGRVSPHKRIRAVTLISEIPRTPSGKIMRRLLIGADRGTRLPGRIHHLP